MATLNEIKISQDAWLRNAERSLRDPFSKTTRERQKQLLLSSVLCVLASSAHVSVAKNAKVIVFQIFQIDSTHTWVIYTAVGVLTLYLLVAFYVGAQQEARVDYNRTKMFVADAFDKWQVLQTAVLDLARAIQDRIAKRTELIKDSVERLNRIRKKMSDVEKALRPVSEARQAMEQQLRELEESRPPAEDRSSYLLWLEKTNKLRSRLSASLAKEIEQQRSLAREENQASIIDGSDTVVDEDRAESDLTSFERHVDAIYELQKTVQYVERNRKWRRRVEVIGPTVFGSLSILLLLISSVVRH